jgi:uncharacterized repeat protein (TIGR01451 family)
MRRLIIFGTSLAALLGLGLGSLGVATAAAQEAQNADLAIVANTANVRHAKIGQQVAFTIIAANNGPDPADLNVTETDLDGLQLISETCDHGISADTPSCEYGTVGPGETVTTTAVVEVSSAEGKFDNNTACVSSEQPLNDPNTQNDCATARLRIVGKRHFGKRH